MKRASQGSWSCLGAGDCAVAASVAQVSRCLSRIRTPSHAFARPLCLFSSRVRYALQLDALQSGVLRGASLVDGRGLASRSAAAAKRARRDEALVKRRESLAPGAPSRPGLVVKKKKKKGKKGAGEEEDEVRYKSLASCHDFGWSRELWARAAKDTGFLAMGGFAAFVLVGYHKKKPTRAHTPLRHGNFGMAQPNRAAMIRPPNLAGPRAALARAARVARRLTPGDVLLSFCRRVRYIALCSTEGLDLIDSMYFLSATITTVGYTNPMHALFSPTPSQWTRGVYHSKLPLAEPTLSN